MAAVPEGLPRSLDELADAVEAADFTVAFRGYEPREVRAYLQDVARVLRSGGDVEAPPTAGVEAPRAHALEEARATVSQFISERRRELEMLRQQSGHQGLIAEVTLDVSRMLDLLEAAASEVAALVER